MELVSPAGNLAIREERDNVAIDAALGPDAYRALFDALDEGIVFHDRDGRVVFANEAAARILGVSVSTLVGNTADDGKWAASFENGLAAHPEEHPAVVTRLTGEPQRNVVMQVSRRGGEPVWVSVNTRAVSSSDGSERDGVVVSFTDVSELRRTERELAASTRRYEALFTNISDVVTVVDATGTMIYVSPNVERIIGRSAEEREGASIFEFVHPDDRFAGFNRLTRTLVEPGSVDRFEARLLDADGRYRVWEVSASNLLDNPDVGGVILNSRDVTDRVDAEAALRERERLYRNIVDTADEGIWIIDAANVTTFVNARLAEMFGVTREEMVGHDFMRYLGDESRAVIDDRLERRRAGIGEHYESVFRRADGTPVWATLSTTPLFDDEGEYTGSLALVTDVTERRAAEAALRQAELDRIGHEAELERRELETQLAQAQRLESLGRLAGGVAHDFNNLLAIILNYAAFTAKKLDSASPLAGDVDQIRRAAEQAAELTNRLLLFGRSDEHDAVPTDVGAIVSEAVALVERSVGPGVRLVSRLDRQAGSVLVDAGQIEQAIVNLILNANDALPDGGTITITTEFQAVTDAGGNVLDQRELVLTVVDNGTGMSSDVAERAFEPFFTTKGVGYGSGLGLAITQTIVARAGGRITIESEVGVGTTIRITFPVVADRIEPAAATAIPTRRGEGARILLVEDNPHVLELIRRILDEAGYEVIAAKSGEDALAQLERDPAGVDLLLTDIVMPGISGVALATRAQQHRADLKVIYITAYARDHLTATPGSAIVVRKPFTADHLLDVMRTQLDPTSAPST